jgi:hypothetical protein
MRLTNGLAGYGLLGLAESLLPIEFGVAAAFANESIELREHRERVRRDMANGQGTSAGTDALETLNCGATALRTRMSGFHGTEQRDAEPRRFAGIAAV